MPVLDLVTPQNNILYLSTALAVFDTVGSPEGVEDAALGSLCLDTATGNWYQKTTALGTLTGWTLFSGGGGGTPSAPVNSFQFNNAGSFGGVATITYDAPYLRIGDGAGSGAIKLYGNQAFHTFFALLAPPQDALENETYYWPDSPPTATGEMFYALTKGANTTFGWTSNMTYNPVGRLSIDVTQNQSAFTTVNNASSGNAAQARLAVTANVSGAALAAYSNTFTTSGLITANSVVLDMDGPTAMILAQAGGTFKIGLGTSTEHLRLTSTVFTLFGSNTGSVTGLNITSAAAGSGVTISTTSSGTNEDMTLSPKGTGAINFTGAMKGPNGSASTPTYGFTNVSGGGFYFGGTAGRFILAAGGSAQLEFGGALVTAGSSLHYGWASSSSPSGANPDTSWTRFGAAVIRAANGSTAAGQLLLGTSTDTADAQLSIYSQATNRASIKVRALTGTLGSQTAFESYDAANALTFWVTTAGNVRLGGVDTASPGSFNLSVQNVLSGTSNTSGQNFSIIGCAGTGNQPGGQIILRVAPAGSSGTTPNTTIVGLAVTGSGQVYGAALHNNSAGMAGAVNQYVGSGTYSPTITAVANCTVSTPGVNFKYLRVGNVVHVTGQLSVDPTTASTLTRVRIELPIASNLTGSVGCQGTGVCGDVFGLSGAVFPDTTNDAAELNFICESGTPANNVWCVSFSYEVA